MRIAIIGGGAAGMMCAATIAELNPHSDVILIEKNDILGKKVLISGGGRCNVTTGITHINELLTKYPRGGKFLTTAMHHFGPADVYAWFENHGVPLKCEEDGRVFPVSDNGHDVVGAFERIFAQKKVQVLTKTNVRSIQKNGDLFTVTTNANGPIEADAVVLAMGGQAYRHTGSTGDGYTLAESLGHHITNLGASLNSFITKEKWPKQISGVSWQDATMSVVGNKKFLARGPFVFTHSGVSGPAVFALSSLVAFEKYGPAAPLPLHINLFPDWNATDLTRELNKKIAQNPKKDFKNVLRFFVPSSVVEVLLAQNTIDGAKNCAEISKAELATTLHWLSALPLSAVGRSAGDEFVTAGGVDLTEVDPTTMESKKCPSLYFAGEILNIDGYTGGFNLQASWATGHAAAASLNEL